MARPLGMTGRGLRLGIGRPGAVVATPTPPPAQPLLATDSGEPIVTENGDRIATE
jgi:hypothetical protein